VQVYYREEGGGGEKERERERTLVRQNTKRIFFENLCFDSYKAIAVITICKYYRGIVFKSDSEAGFIDFKTAGWMRTGRLLSPHRLFYFFFLFFSHVLTLTEYNLTRKGRDTSGDKISFHERHLN